MPQLFPTDSDFFVKFSRRLALRISVLRSMPVLKKIAAGGIILLLIAGIATGRYFFFPDVAGLRNHNPAITSFMKYREVQWRKQGREQHAGTTWVPLERISPNLVKAVVVSEDAKFWQHHGFDFAAMRYAAQENIGAKKMKFGASTISQQLVKNLYLKPSKNLFRKAAEAILTWRMERTLSKSRILEIYLNVIEWGDGIFGIERASRHYFGKSAADLTAGEAARLAVVLPNPRRLNPLSDGRYVERRSDIIFRRMNPGAIRKLPDRNDTAMVNDTAFTIVEDAVDSAASVPEPVVDTGVRADSVVPPADGFP
jgi:monofunctional biosynthetic peptidoglycan transglycosylase